jgi:hypothetical protein
MIDHIRYHLYRQWLADHESAGTALLWAFLAAIFLVAVGILLDNVRRR